LKPTAQSLITNYFPKIGTGVDINSANGRIPFYVSNLLQTR